jgi:hypothetical protein
LDRVIWTLVSLCGNNTAFAGDMDIRPTPFQWER